MKSILDEAEAFSVLESFGAADFDFTVQHARFFRSPHEVVFFLFCPGGGSKGARVFAFENPPAPGEIENDLLAEVMKLGGDVHAEELRDQAAQVIRDFLETKGASHYFFDAH